MLLMHVKICKNNLRRYHIQSNYVYIFIFIIILNLFVRKDVTSSLLFNLRSVLMKYHLSLLQKLSKPFFEVSINFQLRYS